MNIIDAACECGAAYVRRFQSGGSITLTFAESALTALESRIRADERQKCCAELAQMHLEQLGRATEHNYFAVASQSLRINSHLTDGDGSQVQAQ